MLVVGPKLQLAAPASMVFMHQKLLGKFFSSIHICTLIDPWVIVSGGGFVFITPVSFLSVGKLFLIKDSATLY